MSGSPPSRGRLSGEHGVRPGDRVLFVAPSVPEFVFACYGILAAGAVAVTANTMATRRDLAYIGDDAGAVLVLGWHGTTPAPEQAADELALPYWELLPGLGQPKGAQLTHGNLDACAARFCEVHAITADDRAVTALPLRRPC
ncbi:AMP-binding protein [Streptomyces sp. NPDC086554]|uniref:AMP-binding protein n=1 Tax=Streptomyces sp. NPDC086554 TaxID=3154864 RepID=UPI00341833CD